MGLMPGDHALAGMDLFRQIIAQHRLYAERLDPIYVGFNLRLPLLRILGCDCGEAGVRFTSA